MINVTKSCSRHRPVLIDFIDRGEVRPGTGAALAHLDRCAACTDVVEATMLTITALRRLGEDAAAVEPPADAWPRLRTRIERWRRRPILMSPLAGVAMSFAIVAVLVLPTSLDSINLGQASSSPAFRADAPISSAERTIESAYLANSRRTATSAVTETVGSFPLNLPAEIRQVRKEVHSAKPSGRPPEPI